MAIKYLVVFAASMVITLLALDWHPQEYIVQCVGKLAVGVFVGLGIVLAMLFLAVKLKLAKDTLTYVWAIQCVGVAHVLGVVLLLIFALYVWVFPSETIRLRQTILAEDGVKEVDLSGGYNVTDEWLAYNLYRVSSYKEGEHGEYTVFLLDVEPALEESFDALVEIFNNTPYSAINNYELAQGVNCQGMTCHIADWCRRNNCPYTVSYQPSHTYITVEHGGKKYEMNFTRHPTIREV